MPGEIKPEHLAKKVLIYIRQSSPNQVKKNRESQDLQYQLAQRAESLGWAKQNIIILDNDLGVTATGVKKRHDFEYLMRRLCAGDAGAIMVLNCSRMARNGREWHQVLEVGVVFKTLVIDSDGIFDPRLPGDRMWLGMKASFSEYEVNQLQALARAALLNKAQRGQLFHNLPAGLESTKDDLIELAPHQRIQQALHGVFEKFDELKTIRQTWKWYQREAIEIPVRQYKDGVGIAWRVPTYSTLNHILTNPLYAGTYIYPRTKTRTRVVDSQVVKTRGHRATAQDNPIEIKNLFQGYISWERFERNQKIIENNTNMKGSMTKGATKAGTSLLAGLIHCGHCSRKMRVHYYAGKSVPYYYCPKHLKVAHSKSCLRLSGRLLDEFVSRQIIVAVEPIAVEAALLAEEKLNQDIRQKSQAFYYALEQAKYEAERIERQFNATEPENHLVSHTLAKRWQKALEKVEELENRYNQSLAHEKPFKEQERERLFALAGDLKKVWQHPKTDFKIKTELVRLLIKDVWLKAVDQTKLKATFHWHSGVHTEFEFNKQSYNSQRSDDIKEQPVDLIKKLALVCDDRHITRILNRAGVKTDDHRAWSEFEITECRKQNNIPAFSQNRYDKRGLVHLKKAAEILDVSLASVLELIKRSIIKANQVIKYAPWEIKRTALEKTVVLRAVATMKKRQQIPFHENQNELSL